MSIRGVAILPILVTLTMCALSARAQTPSAAPRLPDGRPDLQGVWDFRTLTPLQRPESQADKAVLTAEEVARSSRGLPSEHRLRMHPARCVPSRCRLEGGLVAIIGSGWTRVRESSATSGLRLSSTRRMDAYHLYVPGSR